MVQTIYSAEVLGFLVAVLIFVVALFCIARGWGNLLTTFILLLFSLFAGFAVANQEIIRAYIQGTLTKSDVSREEFDQLKQEVEQLKKQNSTTH